MCHSWFWFIFNVFWACEASKQARKQESKQLSKQNDKTWKTLQPGVEGN